MHFQLQNLFDKKKTHGLINIQLPQLPFGEIRGLDFHKDSLFQFKAVFRYFEVRSVRRILRVKITQ